MSKPIKLAAIALAVALAVPAASWWIGRNIEAAVDEQYRQLQAQSFLDVKQRTYERRIFTATETTTLALSQEWLNTALDESDETQNEIRAALADMTITLRTHYQHGPFPGWRYFGAGEAETRLVQDERIKPYITKLYGNQDPFISRVVFDFEGGGVMHLDSPGFDYLIEEDDLEGKLVWQGINAKVNFNRDLSRYDTDVTMGGITLQDTTRQLLNIANLHLVSTQHRPYSDDQLFYIGKSVFTLDTFDVRFLPTVDEYGDASENEPITLSKIKYEADMPMNGNLINLHSRLGTQSAKIGDQEFGPVRFDFSLHNLDGRTFARLYHELLKASQVPQSEIVDDPTAMLAPLSEPALALLAFNPELRIDEFSFTSPYGKAELKLRAGFNGLKPDEANDPFALMSKFDANGELSVPLELLVDQAMSAAESEEEALLYSMQLESQVQSMVEQGFLVRENDQISTRAAFKDGELTVMDKPFNPLTMGQ